MNQKQRDARKTPEGKAKEAQASRRSYWKRKQGVGNKNGGHDPKLCSTCIRLDAQHDLGLGLGG